MRRSRLDAELVRRGQARSRAEAAELIAAGRVLVAGQVATKAGYRGGPRRALLVRDADADPRWASRGAHKLIGALDAFGDVAVDGRRCLDAGASTGGFTDVLLRRGARRGGRRRRRLRTARCGPCRPTIGSTCTTAPTSATSHPRTSAARSIWWSADLSFISLTLVLPALVACARSDADLLPMVKPQFEVGKDRLGSGGVVRDPALRAEAVATVVRAAGLLGWGMAGVVASPLPGPSGNVEFFVHLRRDTAVDDPFADGRCAELIALAVGQGPV